ncbi:GntR family transcriptional regulator [Actinomarinicola tropica]|uniref:GntR family transcriptional regulator n=1 Tax=Actinomarinicola tropica TaxID=2789776 RepID=A0A5Q2RQH4_9ACTN|nr:GntR family transcriptional regulator [Actinomarinicola tropica]QGG96150.1 GntR family transcriptional regulator [Actinomarinicola tropica]
MILEVDHGSPVPPFEQIRSQVAEAIATGALLDGSTLPSIRQLAADLDVAPGTVARAYRELDAAGLVTTEGRRGTVVRAPAAPIRPSSDEGLAAAARRFADEVRALGAQPSDALDAVRAALVPPRRPLGSDPRALARASDPTGRPHEG